MAYKISDECISCGACEATCPVGAISAGDAHYQIDADTCISCGFLRGRLPCQRDQRRIRRKGKARLLCRALFFKAPPIAK